VGLAALLAIYQGGLPNGLQNRDLARRVVASETWTNITEDNTYEVLESLSTNHTPAVPVGEAVATLFVTIGYLLAIYSRPLGYANSYELLDALLDEIEKA
jgi:hypothetical protein